MKKDTDKTKEQLIAELEGLREREAFRSQVFDSSHLPIVVMEADTFRYIDCNPAAIEFYGYTSKEQVLGLTPMDVSAPFQYDGSTSTEKALFYIEKAKTEKSVVFEWKHQRPDRTVWDAEVHLLSSSWGDKMLLQFTLVDITERKQAEEALKENGKKYHKLSTLLRLMADNMPDLLWAKNLNKCAFAIRNRTKSRNRGNTFPSGIHV